MGVGTGRLNIRVEATTAWVTRNAKRWFHLSGHFCKPGGLWFLMGWRGREVSSGPQGGCRVVGVGKRLSSCVPVSLFISP